jgi:hypothetical protein
MGSNLSVRKRVNNRAYIVRADRLSKLCSMKRDEEYDGGQVTPKTNSGESI